MGYLVQNAQNAAMQQRNTQASKTTGGKLPKSLDDVTGADDTTTHAHSPKSKNVAGQLRDTRVIAKSSASVKSAASDESSASAYSASPSLSHQDVSYSSTPNERSKRTAKPMMVTSSKRARPAQLQSDVTLHEIITEMYKAEKTAMERTKAIKSSTSGVVRLASAIVNELGKLEEQL